MKRIITDRAIFEGETMPPFYGIAYRDIAMRQAICYPIPLNWLVRWGRELYFALRGASGCTLINPQMSGLEKMLDEAYRRGVLDGPNHKEDNFTGECFYCGESHDLRFACPGYVRFRRQLDSLEDILDNKGV